MDGWMDAQFGRTATNSNISSDVFENITLGWQLHLDLIDEVCNVHCATGWILCLLPYGWQGNLELMCCTCSRTNVVVESMQQTSREADVTWRALLLAIAVATSGAHHRSTSLFGSCAHPGDSSFQPTNSVRARFPALPVHLIARFKISFWWLKISTNKQCLCSFSCSSCAFDHNEDLEFHLHRMGVIKEVCQLQKSNKWCGQIRSPLSPPPPSRTENVHSFVTFLSW